MANTDQPNIVVIWGDDIGISNLSCYSDGLMGYRTPNIDRLADEGVRFTDSYGEQSCTAGRSAFVTGQSVYRTGLSKVGLPGAETGIQDEDPTIAELLKPLGYATGQFGKNHLGDRDEHLPTQHGFDEFFGNLYHLNAEEEPEHPDYPDPEHYPNFRERFGPRGVLHSKMTSTGKHTIKDTGPLTKKRMQTIDDEIVDGAIDFIERKHKRSPFFLWVNTTHMHFRTYTKRRSVGQSGRWQSPYHDTMIDHDKHVGRVLDTLDRLGLAENTIVLYSTDNGVHMNSWPDAGMTPFRSEKNTNWEGAFRVPEIIRWPGKIPAGVVSNEMVSHLDWLPTLLAAAGEPDIRQKLMDGHDAGDKKFKVHLDGYNLVPYLTGEADESPRNEFFYFSDDGDLVAFRYDNWKFVFMQQRMRGTLALWGEPFVATRMPYLYNLRTDPFEKADVTSNTYWDWYLDRAFLVVPAQADRRRVPEHVRRLPAADGGSELLDRSGAGEAQGGDHERPLTQHREMVRIQGGEFTMGSDEHYPEEAPARRVAVDGFRMDSTAVTNAEFGAFVEETGYLTVAERPLDPADFPGAPRENLVPGSLVFKRTEGPVDLRHLNQWWAWTPGASWKHPEGPDSSPGGREDHPVVHVAYEDAQAYADWASKELPTEAEWELAARGGPDGATYTWGDAPEHEGQKLANYWHGDFPWRPEQGYGTTAPVGSYPPNGFGLFDMAGNVWEWTTDWYGGGIEESYDPAQPQFRVPRKVIKGGSFLCADSYCLRYRPAARRPQMIDTGMSHIGFRCVLKA